MRPWVSVLLIPLLLLGQAAAQSPDEDDFWRPPNLVLFFVKTYGKDTLAEWAESDEPWGLFLFAYQNYLGIEIDVDKVAAGQLMEQAARTGLPAAQFALGLFFYVGEGVIKDLPRAHMWLNVAAASGAHEKAAEVRNNLEKYMTRAAVDQATRMAHRCLESAYQECG